MKHFRFRFNGVLAWVMISGIVLVALTITSVNVLDRLVIEEAAAENLHAEFLRAAGSVSRILGNAGDIHNLTALRDAFQDILELRPGIRLLEVFEISGESATLILSSAPQGLPVAMTLQDRTAIEAGTSVTRLDDSVADRAWLITAPIMVHGRIVGALRGRFSLWKYDRLIQREGKLAKGIGIGAVVLTSLVFLALIRMKVQRPVSRVLDAMRRAEAGDLTSQAIISGPSDIQEVARQFNRMLERIREQTVVKERLLDEIQRLNDTLMARVAEATSELGRANVMLVETRVQAERAEKLAALGELSAMIAHELGNPLNTMSGHLQLLMKDHPYGEKENARLAIVQSEIQRMTCIIRHVLDSTNARVRTTRVDLHAVIQDTVSLMLSGLQVCHVHAKTNFMPIPPFVKGDSRALHGMLFNLVTNAIQAMPNGGILEVGTRLLQHDESDIGYIVLEGPSDMRDGGVRVTVSDTGHGIPEEDLGRIFQPFFTTRHGEGGTGLGLAICQRAVSSMDGRLAVQSAVGQGTVFTIDLPMWREEM